MKILIVHAHPEPRSFCSVLSRFAHDTLMEQGHEVMCSDLYGQGFNPVASAADFSQRGQSDYMLSALDQRLDADGETIAADIQAEIDKVRAADLVIFTFPIYWFSSPAILKGWFDRAFVSGLFCGGLRAYGRRGMVGKRALFAATIGGPEYLFGQDGLHGQLMCLFKHQLQGTLAFAGFDVLPPFIAHHVPYFTQDEREAVMHDWQTCLLNLGSATPLPMPGLIGQLAQAPALADEVLL